MNIDSHHLAAANDNAVQLVLPLHLPTCPKTPARVTPSSKSASEQIDKPTQEPEPAKPERAQKRGTSLARKQQLAEDQLPQSASGEVVNIKRERITRNSRLRELNEMLDQAQPLAAERLELAKAGWAEPEEQDAFIKQWATVSGVYCKLLSTLHKHHAFLSSEN